MLHEDLSRDIIGASMEVLNELKPGLDEKLYERALVVELRKRGHTVASQQRYEVKFKGEKIGQLIPDLIVDDLVVVDAKVVRNFDDNHISQMIGYLAITKLKLGLLLNFKFAKRGWKRIVRETTG